MIQEILSLGFAWGVCALVVAFWYWLMKNIGTF